MWVTRTGAFCNPLGRTIHRETLCKMFDGSTTTWNTNHHRRNYTLVTQITIKGTIHYLQTSQTAPHSTPKSWNRSFSIRNNDALAHHSYSLEDLTGKSSQGKEFRRTPVCDVLHHWLGEMKEWRKDRHWRLDKDTDVERLGSGGLGSLMGSCNTPEAQSVYYIQLNMDAGLATLTGAVSTGK